MNMTGRLKSVLTKPPPCQVCTADLRRFNRSPGSHSWESLQERSLVTSDGRWNCRTLLRVQCLVNDRPVLQLRLSSGSVGVCECVLPPVLFNGNWGLALQGLCVVQLVHPVLEVLTSVASS